MPQWIWMSAFVWTLVCFTVNAYTWRIAYPLWRAVGDQSFAAVHRLYMQRLDLIITVPHVLMFFSSTALLFTRPVWFQSAYAVAVFVLETAVIVISAAVAGPVHSRFTRKGTIDKAGMRRLISVSAVRTLMMAGASGIMFQTLHQQL